MHLLPAFKYSFILAVILSLSFACGGSSSSATAEKETEEEAMTNQPPATNASSQNETQSTTNNFDKRLSLQGVTYHVTANGNRLKVQPAGIQNTEPAEMTIDGMVTGAEIEDLNSDGCPELVVHMRSGAKQKASVAAFSCLGKRSMVQVYMPPFENSPDAKGYDGYDETAVVERMVVRRYPEIINGQRTGKTRQIQYKMVPGENMPTFVIEKVVEY